MADVVASLVAERAITVAPVDPAAATIMRADPPSDLADACDWAAGHMAWIDSAAKTEDRTDDELDREIDRHGLVFARALTEPSLDLRTVTAKARLAMDDFERFRVNNGEKIDDTDRMVLTVLREISAIASDQSNERAQPTGVDRGLVAAIGELRRLDAAIHDLIDDDPRDADEIPGYEALESARDDVLARLEQERANGAPGIQSKAHALLTTGVRENYEVTGDLARSLAQDILDIQHGAFERAVAEGSVLAASGIDHRDGTMSYCDANGTVSRRPVASYVGFAVMQLHAKVRSEIARQRIAANSLPPDEHEAWEMKVRRELRADAVFALAFRPNDAFEAEEARRNASDPDLDPDAALIALETEFLPADKAASQVSAVLSGAQDACVEPEMPVALKVWRNDWIFSSLPRPEVQTLADGRCRSLPYGRTEVEHLRANPCMAVYVGGGDGEPTPDGHSRRRPDVQAQKRADAIVTAWDAWQAEIATARADVNLPALEAAHRDALEARNAVLQRVRETPALGLAGLAIKARIAANLLCETDLRAVGLEGFGPADGDGLLYGLAGDVLALTGGLPAAHRYEG